MGRKAPDTYPAKVAWQLSDSTTGEAQMLQASHPTCAARRESQHISTFLLSSLLSFLCGKTFLQLALRLAARFLPRAVPAGTVCTACRRDSKRFSGGSVCRTARGIRCERTCFGTCELSELAVLALLLRLAGRLVAAHRVVGLRLNTEDAAIILGEPAVPIVDQEVIIR